MIHLISDGFLRHPPPDHAISSEAIWLSVEFARQACERAAAVFWWRGKSTVFSKAQGLFSFTAKIENPSWKRLFQVAPPLNSYLSWAGTAPPGQGSPWWGSPSSPNRGGPDGGLLHPTSVDPRSDSGGAPLASPLAQTAGDHGHRRRGIFLCIN